MPTRDSFGFITDSDFDMGLSDPLAGYRTTVPSPVRLPSMPRPPKPRKPSKKELAEAQARLESQQLDAEAQRIVDELRSQPWWSNASFQRRKEILDNYENNVWPQYATSRYGNDTIAANRLKHRIMAPLRQEVADLEDASSGIDGWLDTMRDALKLGKYSGNTMWEGADFLWDIFWNSDIPEEARDSLRRLRIAQEEQRKGTEALMQANAALLNDARRQRELEEEEGTDFWLFKQMYEEKSLRPLISALLQQWPQVAASLGLALVGAGAGTAVAPGAGTAVGARVGGALGSALAGAGTSSSGVVSDIVQNIYEMSDAELKKMPRYKELASEGKSLDEIRVIMAYDAAKSIALTAAGVGGALGVASPEAMLTGTSAVQGLIRGGLGRRVATGAVLGGAEEFGSEAGEQVMQNVGVNTGTGQEIPITEGAMSAGATGATLGAFLGGIGGIRSPEPVAPSPTAPTTTPESSVAGEVGTGNAGMMQLPTVGAPQAPATASPALTPDQVMNSVYHTNAVGGTHQLIDQYISDLRGGQALNDADISRIFTQAAAAAEGQLVRADVDAFIGRLQQAANAANPLGTTDVRGIWLSTFANDPALMDLGIDPNTASAAAQNAANTTAPSSTGPNQPQPAVNQPQPAVNQPQSAVNQQPPTPNQQTAAVKQQPPTPNQQQAAAQQIVPNQPQPTNQTNVAPAPNAQPTTTPPAKAPSATQDVATDTTQVTDGGTEQQPVQTPDAPVATTDGGTDQQPAPQTADEIQQRTTPGNPPSPEEAADAVVEAQPRPEVAPVPDNAPEVRTGNRNITSDAGTTTTDIGASDDTRGDTTASSTTQEPATTEESGGSGGTDTGTGPEADSGTETASAGTDGGTDTAEPTRPDGDRGTAESSGTGRTARESTGTPESDLSPDQSTDAEGQGADSGRTGANDAAADEQSDFSQRVTAEQVQQRAVDGRFSADVGRIATLINNSRGHVIPEAELVSIYSDFAKKRRDYYEAAQLPQDEILQEVATDITCLDTIVQNLNRYISPEARTRVQRTYEAARRTLDGAKFGTKRMSQQQRERLKTDVSLLMTRIALGVADAFDTLPRNILHRLYTLDGRTKDASENFRHSLFTGRGKTFGAHASVRDLDNVYSLRRNNTNITNYIALVMDAIEKHKEVQDDLFISTYVHELMHFFIETALDDIARINARGELSQTFVNNPSFAQLYDNLEAVYKTFTGNDQAFQDRINYADDTNNHRVAEQMAYFAQRWFADNGTSADMSTTGLTGVLVTVQESIRTFVTYLFKTLRKLLNKVGVKLHEDEIIRMDVFTASEIPAAMNKFMNDLMQGANTESAQLVMSLLNLNEAPNVSPYITGSLRNILDETFRDKVRELYASSEQSLDYCINRASDYMVDYIFGNYVDDTRTRVDKAMRSIAAQSEQRVSTQSDTADVTAAELDTQLNEARTQAERQALDVMTAIEASGVENASFDPDTQNSVLAMYGSTTMEETEDFRAGADIALSGIDEASYNDDFAIQARSITTHEPRVTPPVSAEERAALEEQLNNLLTENMPQSGQGTELPAGDGVQTNYMAASTVMPTINIDSQTADELGAAARLLKERDLLTNLSVGNQVRLNVQKEVAQSTYGPRGYAGRLAHIATNLRRAFQDGGAWFSTWCSVFYPTQTGDPNDNIINKAFGAVSSRIDAASTNINNTVIGPVVDWMQQTALQLDMDWENFAKDIGLYRTALHTIECARYQEIQLNEELIAAYNIANDSERAIAVKKASERLQQYEDYQAGMITDFAVYGGRSVSECEAIIERLESVYGKDICNTAQQLIGRSTDWLTNFLAANGLISELDVSTYGDFNFYTPMNTMQQTSDRPRNDLTFFAPRNNFHRYGSVTPALDSFTTLCMYARRAARSVGMADFGRVLYFAHKAMSKTDNITGTEGQFNYYNGMAFIPSAYIDEMRYGNNRTAQQREWANDVVKRACLVVRIREEVPTKKRRKKANTDVEITPEMVFDSMKTYYVLVANPQHLDPAAAKQAIAGINMEDVKEALTNPFCINDNPNNIIEAARFVTRGYASTYTRMRPVFPLVNSVRDTCERSFFLSSRNYTTEDGRSVSGLTLAGRLFGFMLDLRNVFYLGRYFATGTSGKPAFDAIMHEFRSSGLESTTNYSRLVQLANADTRKTLADRIPASIRALGAQTVGRVIDFFGAYNRILYTLPSLGQFTVMRRAGLSFRDAEYNTRRLMDLQQRGRYTHTLSAIYPFVTSVFQTAANFTHTLGFNRYIGDMSPAGKAAFKQALKSWGMLLTGAAGMYALIPLMALRLGNDDEDEGYRRLDLIPLGSLTPYIIIGTGEGNDNAAYIKFPIGFGAPLFASTMAYGWDRVQRGKMSQGDYAVALLTTLGKTLVPNSQPSFEFSRDPMAFLAQTLAPMIMQPALQVATNRSYSGQRIAFDTFSESERRSDRANLTTAAAWKDMAQAIYSATNGTLDFSPEQLRTLVNGYLGGPFQAVTAWIEHDPLYSHPSYTSTRDELGPLGTALGATSIYNHGMNISQSAFFTAKEYYEGRIKAAGIGHILRGEQWDKRALMEAAGFSKAEIDDYMLIYNTNRELSELNTDLRQKLGKLVGPDMDEATVRAMFWDWSTERKTLQERAYRHLNFYQPSFRRDFSGFDPVSTEQLRRNVPGMAAVDGNVNIKTRSYDLDEQGNPAETLTGVMQDDDGLWVVFPLIGPNGEHWTMDQAWSNYLETGEHLGKYRTEASAEDFADSLQ